MTDAEFGLICSFGRRYLARFVSTFSDNFFRGRGGSGAIDSEHGFLIGVANGGSSKSKETFFNTYLWVAVSLK